MSRAVDRGANVAAVVGIGMALTEEYYYDDAGVLRNASLLDYRIPTTLDVPMIETIIVEVPNPGHPLGVRGVGECNIVPPLGAIANAINDAIGIPIIMYNIPGRSIVDINVDTMKRLYELKNITGVKDATANVARVSQQRAARGDHREGHRPFRPFSAWNRRQALKGRIVENRARSPWRHRSVPLPRSHLHSGHRGIGRRQDQPDELL